MANTLTFTDIQDALREAYQGGSTDDLLARDHPLLGMIKRDRKFSERLKRIPIKYGKPQGASPVFATAQANAYAAVAEAFEVPTVDIYQVCNIQGRLIEQAAIANGDRFLQEIVDMVDDSMEEVTNRMAWQAFRSSGGAVGRVGSGVASPITMANPEDVDGLELGMVITANDTNDATTPRAGSGVITGIDYNTGEVTYTGTITALAVNDYIFIQGFAAAAASGLEDWCPELPPGATPFFGVVRNVNSRLGGTRLDLSTATPEEVFSRANARAGRLPSKPDAWFMHPTDVANMEISLSTAKMVPIESRTYKFGYEAFSAYGAKIIPDNNVPRGVMWGVPFDHVELMSIGDAPKPLNSDGNEILRAATADTYEGRVGARWQINTDAPLLLVRVKIPV
jgi:hypothetical protein